MTTIQKLFTPFTLGSMTMPNRIIRAAMYEPYCYNGHISEKFTNTHLNYFDGGIGLSTTGLASISTEGAVSENQLDLSKCSKEELIGFTDAIHEVGGLSSLQISYIGPYEFLYKPEGWPIMQYTEDQLEELKNEFVERCVLALESGFDAIEIHHTFLSMFFYENSNSRTDKYGGSLENRARYPAKLCRGIRDAVGDDFPIFAKFTMNPTLTQDDFVYNAQVLENEGGVSALVAFQTVGVEDFTELYCMENGIHVQKNVEIPVVYSGGVQDGEDLELVMEHFELVQVGRTLLRDHEFPLKVQECVDVESCLKCNKCHSFLWGEDPELKCIFEK